jgi:hypothetical protein
MRLSTQATNGGADMIKAAGARIGWGELPEWLRSRAEKLIGGRVVDAVSQRGGFSPGTADRVVTGDGRRAFVKAVSLAINPESYAMARREASYTARMPAAAPVPRLLGEVEEDGWMVLILQDVEGRQPFTPWAGDEMDATAEALDRLADALTPCPIEELPRASERFATQFGGWSAVAAEPVPDLNPWAAAHLDDLQSAARRGLDVLAKGETIAHGDIRADNLLVRDDGTVLVVDWPWASRAPRWLDRLLLAMDVVVHGGDGDRLLAGLNERDAADVCAGYVGYLMERSRRPSPGIPFVRAFQRAQADALMPWLRERLPS